MGHEGQQSLRFFGTYQTVSREMVELHGVISLDNSKRRHRTHPEQRAHFRNNEGEVHDQRITSYYQHEPLQVVSPKKHRSAQAL